MSSSDLYSSDELDYGLVPTDIGGTTANTGWIPVDCEYITAIFGLAADYTDATCACSASQATTSGGGGAKPITGLAGFSLTAASQKGIMQVRSENLDVNNGFCYVQFVVTEGANNGVNYAAIQTIKSNVRFKAPTNTFDQTDNAW